MSSYLLQLHLDIQTALYSKVSSSEFLTAQYSSVSVLYKLVINVMQILEMVRPAASKLGLESPVELWGFFTQQCKQRLHVVLCFSPIGNAFRDRLRQNPSLVNCCTIDWFQVSLHYPACSLPHRIKPALWKCVLHNTSRSVEC